MAVTRIKMFLSIIAKICIRQGLDSKGTRNVWSQIVARYPSGRFTLTCYTGVQRVVRTIADLSLPRSEKPWLPGERAKNVIPNSEKKIKSL